MNTDSKTRLAAGGRRIATRRVRPLPAEDRTCGWLEPLDPPPPPRRLAGDHQADAVIVGAGYVGTAIARRLHELRPDWRLMVVDAQRVGMGTSGRNSGFVVDLTDVAARMSPPVRAGYVRIARSGIEELRELVEGRGIDCAWDEKGWIRGAAGEKGVGFLEPLPELYDELGMDYQHLDAEAMAEITGMSFYRQGIRLPGYPLVNGAALARGLVEVLPEAVEVYEESPVTRYGGSGHYRVEIGEGQGSIEAPLLFLATNGYTPCFGVMTRRVFPLYTFGSMTRVLTEDEQEALGGENEWGILAMDPMGSSVRRTRDQRLLIRNWSHYEPSLRIGEKVRAEMIGHNRRAFDVRFPELRHVEFEYSWAGLLGTTFNSQINFGEIRPGLLSTSGFTGAGIAMGTAAGRLLVDLALGEDSIMLRDLQALPGSTVMPPDPFRSIGGRFLTARMNAKADHTL